MMMLMTDDLISAFHYSYDTLRVLLFLLPSIRPFLMLGVLSLEA